MNIILSIIVIIISLSIIKRSDHNCLGTVKSNLIGTGIGLGIMLIAYLTQ